MPKFTTYCQFVASIENDNVHHIYHDTQYGFPIHDDNELFGRLILEINQAGLNWTIILRYKTNRFSNTNEFFHKRGYDSSKFDSF